ncbi:MAG TPA: transposase [Isosphaeraceae bacterium]|nr:transposase [Isosphaeraceae bacterium]
MFSTKMRDPLITPGLQPELYRYLGGIVRGERGVLLEVGGMPYHVHMLTRFRADVSVSEMLRLIKTNSSKWINERPATASPFGWQTGYGAFSVSASQVDSVSEYSKSQEEHHRTMSFEEEFVRFLKKHGIKYDEQYLWD